MKNPNLAAALSCLFFVFCLLFVNMSSQNDANAITVTRSRVACPGTYGISGGIIINTYTGRVVAQRKSGGWEYFDVYGTPKEFQPVTRDELLQDG